MTHKIIISEFLLKRIQKIKQECTGALFGVMYQGTLFVLGFTLELKEETLSYRRIVNNFPTEIDLCGMIKFGICNDDQSTDEHLMEILKDVDVTDNPLILNCELGTCENMKASIFKNNHLEEISYETITESELYEQFFFARLECCLKLVCEEDAKSIASASLALRKKIACGSVAFTVYPNKPIQIALTSGPNGPLVSLTNLNNSDKHLFTIDNDFSDIFSYNSANQQYFDDSNANGFKTITIGQISIKQSHHSSSNAHCKLTNEIKSKTICIPLQIHAMSIIHYKTKLGLVYDILIESIVRAMRLQETNLIQQIEEKSRINVPKTFNFLPDGLGYFFSCIYPEYINDDDEYLMKNRKQYHQLLGLPFTRPYFRRCLNFNFAQNNSANEVAASILTNPHEGLNYKSIGRQSLVHGLYTYHHYMQDNFNDDGWGCAYRSLQTICSWFKLQGYTTRSIPTHKEIQEYLYKIGDKPKTFVNSRQWIGSTEVSMCLSGLLNIDSKILHVTSGSELAYYGSELVHHFETQGTPIMIGGGVLAHTIIGVDFNNTTGDVAFLILDPHYTGEDDLKKIQAKGWCGWKGKNFWDKKSYYNLCMPQKPICY
uniref:Probable Ufm1-specific protease 2 n=1 Tax=Corethrella appendiculata TaxID=1370023 RepID=U5ENV8_9DIPT